MRPSGTRDTAIARSIATRDRLAFTPADTRFLKPNDDAALIDYAQPIVNELRANMVRVDSDFSATRRSWVGRGS